MAVAYSKPPNDRLRWTLRLLADRVVELQLAEHWCSDVTPVFGPVIRTDRGGVGSKDVIAVKGLPVATLCW